MSNYFDYTPITDRSQLGSYQLVSERVLDPKLEADEGPRRSCHGSLHGSRLPAPPEAPLRHTRAEEQRFLSPEAAPIPNSRFLSNVFGVSTPMAEPIDPVMEKRLQALEGKTDHLSFMIDGILKELSQIGCNVGINPMGTIAIHHDSPTQNSNYQQSSSNFPPNFVAGGASNQANSERDMFDEMLIRGGGGEAPTKAAPLPEPPPPPSFPQPPQQQYRILQQQEETEPEVFDEVPVRKLGSMSWCRRCKIQCVTMEGLVLHSLTSEHQNKTIALVLNIKQDIQSGTSYASTGEKIASVFADDSILEASVAKTDDTRLVTWKFREAEVAKLELKEDPTATYEDLAITVTDANDSASTQKQGVQSIGELASSGSVVDDWFGSDPIADRSTTGRRSEDDPFAEARRMIDTTSNSLKHKEVDATDGEVDDILCSQLTSEDLNGTKNELHDQVLHSKSTVRPLGSVNAPLKDGFLGSQRIFRIYADASVINPGQLTLEGHLGCDYYSDASQNDVDRTMGMKKVELLVNGDSQYKDEEFIQPIADCWLEYGVEDGEAVNVLLDNIQSIERVVEFAFRIEAGISKDGQTCEHALFAFTLGVKQMICCYNEMGDYLVGLCKDILQEYLDTAKPGYQAEFSARVQLKPYWLIPIGSGKWREARYVPAYSTRLKFKGASWLLRPANASDPMESVDPAFLRKIVWDLGIESFNIDCLSLYGSCYHAIGKYRVVVKEYDVVLDLELEFEPLRRVWDPFIFSACSSTYPPCSCNSKLQLGPLGDLVLP